MKPHQLTWPAALLPAILFSNALWAGPDWEAIQTIKADCLSQAATHAMEQQKTGSGEPLPIRLDTGLAGGGDLRASPLPGGGLAVEGKAAPVAGGRPADAVWKIPLPEPLDMLSRHSGLAMTVRTLPGTSPEARWGARLIGTNGNTAEILPVVPLLSRWGQESHEIYLDWAFINYADVERAVGVLESVAAIELTVGAARRSPEFGPSQEPQQASFELSALRLVDYLQGSYDPDRHSWGWDGSNRKDLTLQHRVLEVTGIVARFGGEKGPASALAALDMAARTQCWDGSFLDGRRGASTVVSGEYTHGFTLWGLLDGYALLEAIRHPALDEKLSIGVDSLSRRDLYQRMIHRAALSRASALPSAYRDDIIRSNTLVYGANRVLGYAIAMRRAADFLRDPDLRQQVLDRYGPIIREIAGAQGAYSGGFPILGEGDRYQGRGIHYDAGYTRTHMDWLVLGIKTTGDPILVGMLRRYQTVIEAAMDAEGKGILALLSERGKGTESVELVIPDATAQVGLEHQLPVMAQWGYNVGMSAWARWEPGARVNHFTNRAHARGYSLGAHSSILLFDLDPVPEPVDTGYRFPRQFPIWSSRFFSKEDGALTRTSRVRIDPDGSLHNDFRIEVGEYLETVGIPVWVESPDGSVTAEAVALDGWPALLADGAPLYLEIGDTRLAASVNRPVPFRLEGTGPVKVTITGPEISLPQSAGGATVPFRAVMLLTAEADGQSCTLTVRNDTPACQTEMTP